MFEFKKEGWDAFLKSVKKRYDLVAPVNRDILRYDKVGHDEEIVLKRPLYSLKKHFLAQGKLFDFYKNKDEYLLFKEKPKAFIATRCDISSVGPLDKIYLRGPLDRAYLKRRKQNLLIELTCEERGENCFCQEQELQDYFDIKIRLVNGVFFADPRTVQGKKELKKFINKHPTPIPKLEVPKKNTRIPLDKVDYKQADKCIACGSCTLICPTCNCYDIKDTLHLNIDNGKRELIPDSCQYQDFSRVAGGFVFRDTKEKRLRHRLHHKIDWFKEKHGIYMCTGCGRCITNCPAKITFIKKVKEEKKAKKK